MLDLQSKVNIFLLAKTLIRLLYTILWVRAPGIVCTSWRGANFNLLMKIKHSCLTLRNVCQFESMSSNFYSDLVIILVMWRWIDEQQRSPSIRLGDLLRRMPWYSIAEQVVCKIYEPGVRIAFSNHCSKTSPQIFQLKHGFRGGTSFFDFTESSEGWKSAGKSRI